MGVAGATKEQPMLKNSWARFVGLLSLVGLALFMGAAQATVTESEPNDNPGEADNVPLDESAVGDCSSGVDFLDVYFASPGWGRANHTLTPSAQTFYVNISAPNGSAIRSDALKGTAAWGFQVEVGGNYSFKVECAPGATGWIFAFSFSAAGGPIEGAGEAEPNNWAGSASEAAAGLHAGIVDTMYDNIDYWSVPIADLSALEITVRSNATTPPTLWTLTLWGEPSAEVGSYFLQTGINPTSFQFAIRTDGTSASYNITVRVESSISKFFAGPSEDEPNNYNDVATRVPLTANTTVRGTFDTTHDQVDIFLLQFSSGSMVVVEFERALYCFACEDEVRLLRSNGLQALDEFGDPIGGTSFEFSALAAAVYYLEVTADYSGGDYEILVNFTAFSLAPGATVSILDGEEAGYLSAIGQGDPEDTPLTSVNLALGGNGTMYGKSVLMGITNSAPVSLQVRFPAGLLLEDLWEECPDYVVTRNQSFSVPAFNYSEFVLVAVKSRTGLKVASTGTLFTIKGMADGKLATITAETAGGNYGYQSEIIAIWAGVGGTSRADIEAYGANSGSVNEAAALLNKVGISSSISSGVQSPGPGTPGTGGTAGAGSGLLIPIAAVLAIVAVVGIVVAMRRKKTGQAPPPMPGPMTAGAPPMPWQARPPGAPPPPYGTVPRAGPPGYAYAPPPGPPQYGPSAGPGPRAVGPPPGGYAPLAPLPPPPPPPPRPNPYAQPYGAQVYVEKSATNPDVVYETVVLPPDPNTMCPKCGEPRKPGGTYCLACGEFFVR